MNRTHISLYYLCTYLLLGGFVLLLFPAQGLKLFLSTGDYGDVFPRVAGMLLAGLGMAPPKVFVAGAALVLNAELRRAFESSEPDLERIASLLEETRRTGVQLDAAELALAAQSAVERLMELVSEKPEDAERLDRLREATEMVAGLPFEVALWRVENRLYLLGQEMRGRLAGPADEEAQRWREAFGTLGRRLRVRFA